MKHILVVRKDASSPSFYRSDKFGKQWVEHRLDGQTLRAIVPSVVSDLREESDTAVTMSSCRGAEAFRNPDRASIADGVNVIVLAPYDPPAAKAEMSGIRLWYSMHWAGPWNGPVLGEKLRQKTLPDWVESFFSGEQLDTWARKGAGNIELWIRPEWDIRTMFPKLFKAPGLVTDKEQDKTPYIKFAPKTLWRIFDADGNEVVRNIKTKGDAAALLEKYIASPEDFAINT